MSEIVIQVWHLNKWDKVKFEWKVYTFVKMDWRYAHWTTEEGKPAVWNFQNLIKKWEYYEQM